MSFLGSHRFHAQQRNSHRAPVGLRAGSLPWGQDRETETWPHQRDHYRRIHLHYTLSPNQAATIWKQENKIKKARSQYQPTEGSEVAGTKTVEQTKLSREKRNPRRGKPQQGESHCPGEWHHVSRCLLYPGLRQIQ